MRTPPTLQRLVPLGWPAAIQAIAALDERVLHLRVIGADAWAIADAHAAVMAIREAFDLWPPEAQMDAAHLSQMAPGELAELWGK